MNVQNANNKPDAIDLLNAGGSIDDDEMPPSLVAADDGETQPAVATDVAMYPEDENIQKVPITIVTGITGSLHSSG